MTNMSRSWRPLTSTKLQGSGFLRCLAGSAQTLLALDPHSFLDPCHASTGIRYIIDNDKAVETDAHAAEDSTRFSLDSCAHRDMIIDHHHCCDALAFECFDSHVIDEDRHFLAARDICIIDAKTS